MTSQYAPITSEPDAPETSPAPAPAEHSPGPAQGRAIWRRVRFWAAILLVLAVGAALVAVVRTRTPQGDLDVGSPTPGGARAVATILGNHGVDVRQSDDIDATIDAAKAGDVTLFLANPALLGSASLRRIGALPSTVRVVLAEPDDGILKDLGLTLRVDDATNFPADVPPGCSDLPEAVSAGSAELHNLIFTRKGAGTWCYDGSLAVAAAPGGAQIVVLGSITPVTNDRLASSGNAALMLGLLSAHDKLLWLRPIRPEQAAADRQVGLFDILPKWVVSAQLLLLVAGLFTVLWRLRRLGPPVSEPLPVVVRSAETTEGRARMYERARARTESYEAIRAGAMSRLLPRLGLGGEPDYRAVVEAVAERTGAPMAAIHHALYGPPPQGDAALVAAADTLDALVRDVLQPRTAADPNRPDGEGPTQ
ncbi:MAG: hypothetical protein JWO79_3936 [Actinomycetia bacterium]|nr:hypothetical protein [Actinomycetes bacterium]